MACQINRTKDGKINEVTTPTGAKSKLFEAIHSNIFLADAETSVKVYNNAYSEKVKKNFESKVAPESKVGKTTEGHKIRFTKNNERKGSISVFEAYEDSEIGFLDYTIDTEGNIEVGVGVETDYQRSGIATEMYDMVEDLTGGQIQPSNDQSNNARAFWEDRSAKSYRYDTGEPKLFYTSSSNKEYDNLEELLINEDFGQVQMGFKNPKNDEFIPIAKFTTKGSEKNEFLHSKVREGLMSADRVLGEDGITRYQGKGEYETTRIVTAIKVADDLAAETGNGRVTVLDNGTIEMEFSNGYSEVVKPNGSVEVIRTENIPEFLKDNPDAQNATDLMVEYTVVHDNPRPIDKEVKSETPKNTDISGIEKSLYGFLESLGFTTTTLKSYRENYNTKHGKDPDISAIADIANRIVAFNEGEVDISDLSEEVAHIAIEAYTDQASIEEALKNVHLTPEYAEFYEFYKNKYAPFFKGEKLERQVKKEILGKILKREFLTRFDNSYKNESQSWLSETLRSIFEWFVDLVSRNQMGHHRRSLTRLNQKIADSVINKSSEDFQAEFEEGVNFFYNAMDKKTRSIEEELLASKRIVEDLYSKALDTPVNQAELESLSKNGSFLELLSSVNVIVGIAENQLNVLLSNVQEAADNKDIISATDQNRFEVLKESMLPTIENIIAELPLRAEELGVTDKESLKKMNNILSISENLPVKMSKVSPLINKDKSMWVDKMLVRILNKFVVTDKQREEIVKGLDGGIKDIGWLGKTFGLSSHSKNLAIQLMHYAVTNIGARVNREFNNIFNKELADITKKGLEKYQKEVIYRRPDGSVTNYYLSPLDEDRFDRELRAEENRLIASLTDFDVEEVDKKRASLTIPEILVDTDKYVDYRDGVRKWKDDVGLHKRFTDEYYNIRDKRFDDADVSKETRDYLSVKNVGRLSRRKKYMQPDGTIDLSKQTEAEKIEDRNDFKQHLLVKSAYDSSGLLKGGLRRVSVSDLTAEEIATMPFKLDSSYTGEVTILVEGQELDNLPGDSRRALDLFNLDMVFRNELKDKSRTNEPIEKFKNTIRDIEATGGNAFEWLMSNASLGLSSNFYEGLGTGESYMDRATDYVNAIEDDEIRFLKLAELENLKRAQSQRKELLKQNKRSDSGIETDVKHMKTEVKKALLELDEEISDIRISLSVPFEELAEEEEVVSYFEQGLNEDYQKMLIESKSSEYDFAIENMPRRSRVKTERFSQQVTDFVKGRKSYLDSAFDAFVNETFERDLIPEDATTDEIISILKDEYAKSNLGSYFKRFQPTGYTQMMNDMKSGELKISDIINKKDRAALTSKYPALKFIDISPEYSWSEDVNNEKFINKKFKTGGPSRQTRFLNKAFFEKYGISEDAYLKLEDEDISQLTPSRNKEEFELLVKVTNLRQMSLDNNGNSNRSKYLRPQISKSSMEQMLSIHKGTRANLKDIFTDMVEDKKDEKQYGEELEGTGINIKVIPKYYQDLLESADLVTENVIEAAMVDVKASIRYKERVRAERDIKAIEYKISQQKFKNSGGKGLRSRILKKGEVSGYYEKAQEMADYHLYGIRQSRNMKVIAPWGQEIDFASIFNTITKYIRNVNLAFNLITDLTSYTTGVYNNLLDAKSGDYYHKSSVLKATKVLPGMIVKYVGESGAMTKTSDLAHLTEFFGIIDPLDRVEESTRNRIVRSANKSFYFASKMANLPVTPKNMLALLYDFKFHNGRFIDYNNFSRLMRVEKEDLTMPQIDALWNAKDDTIFSNLTIDPTTGVDFNEKFVEKFGDKSNEEFDEIHEQLIAKMTQINQSVDAIISEADQVAGSRDALVNATMMHRSWFIINMTRKFKGKHFNIATGQIEEGHYRSILNTLLKLKGGRKAFEEATEEHEVRNLKRFGWDAIGIGLLVTLSNLLLGADDDDDTYIENLAQLITIRTANESMSQSILGTPGSMEEIYTNPVMQFGNMKDLATGLYNWKDDIKREKALKQLLPYRRYRQLEDLQHQVSTYLFFNTPNKQNDNTFSTLLFVGKDKEE